MPGLATSGAPELIGDLHGNLPLAAHRVAILSTVPLRNRVDSYGPVAPNLRVASNGAVPFPRKDGVLRPRPFFL